MNTAAYTDRMHPAARLSVLEAGRLAHFVRSEAGLLGRIADHTLARAENRLIEYVFISRLKKVFRDFADPLRPANAMMDALRQRQSEGKMAGLSMMASADGTPRVDTEESSSADAWRLSRQGGERLLFYVPCGGFILPPSPKQLATAQRLASACNCRLVIGKHRLAPEHPFPAAIHDIADHYEALLAGGHHPGNIIAGGDTSGACIMLSALMELRRRGVTMPAGVLLFSPWADLSLSGWSYITGSVSATSPYRMEIAAFCARLYLQDTLPTNPMASPVYGEVKGLPPMAIHSSRYDIRFDDALRLVEKAEKAGVPCRINYWDSPRHHLERFKSRDADKSFELAAAFVEEVMA
ncbi:alpha/beta hydrolase fold domain-containing protein [Aquisalinus flavus]|uniref:Alpha/beta hydrolase fold-3 domain-containing protein n=1 Tax=Aquisalinus flavus TaxID=1526572 RepID=A0A8J2V6Z8_9PROT|nr:alpha/beta hydrolase fold domain-containing protein [Aquisalinus flavus]MBD0427181.1 alpha/beta hydrolase fold domain-containing protein [Aquisalinus flavus]GGC99000.1 hypothetical protein GCM10011342_04940 [Aquisalinus flavus]